MKSFEHSLESVQIFLIENDIGAIMLLVTLYDPHTNINYKIDKKFNIQNYQLSLRDNRHIKNNNCGVFDLINKQQFKLGCHFAV